MILQRLCPRGSLDLILKTHRNQRAGWIFFNDNMIPDKSCISQDDLACKRQATYSRRKRKCAGSQANRKIAWGWLKSGTGGLLTFSIHSQPSFSTRQETCVLPAMGSYSYSLGKGEKNCSSPCSSWNNRGKGSERSALSHMPTITIVMARDVRNPWTEAPLWVH